MIRCAARDKGNAGYDLAETETEAGCGFLAEKPYEPVPGNPNGH